MCDGAHGSPLVPWPNRLADGRYRFDGVDYQVAITEPDKGNAIHGLLPPVSLGRGARGAQPGHHGDPVWHPLTGYPFLLDVEVDYLLDDDADQPLLQRPTGASGAAPMALDSTLISHRAAA